MFDHIYSTLIKKVPYRTLIFIPIILSLLMLAVIFVIGIPLGIDFKGGTLIEVSAPSASAPDITAIENDLKVLGLKDLKVYSGRDIETGMEKVEISSIDVVGLNDTALSGVLTKYFGVLRDADTATVSLQSPPPSDLKTKLALRLKQSVDLSYDNSTGMLKIVALDMNQGDLESALHFYLGPGVSIDFEKRNINIAKMQPTLGEKLRDDGVKAAVLGYVLMAFVIFIAFRNFVPSMAVLLSATCDAVITLGLMSIFNIVLEPASLVALLMLVGYSVDTDVLLTSRVLKKRKGEIDEGVDSAIKTGLTMTGTTFVVMLVVVIVSMTITHVSTLASIASVLLLGLMADVASTWFMNAGILKWYLEERGGKFRVARRGQKSVSV